MSFRDLRNFTEIMRALGYPRLISVENFRTPNFGLVADCLYWMVQRYDPNMNISDDIDSEEDRVDFLKNIAQVMMAKARVKLNMKKLYAADGHAVKELLKIARMLYQALRTNQPEIQNDNTENSTFALNAKLHDLKQTRMLGTEITERGAKLYDLLGQERDLRDARTAALRFLDGASNMGKGSEQQHIERSIQGLIASMSENFDALQRRVKELEKDQKTLKTKIKKKTADLERSDKRLKSLTSVRPAFMDEYEKLERELGRQYEIYLERFRNLDYLEHELATYNEKEYQKATEAEKARKRRADRILDEQKRLYRGDEDMGDSGRMDHRGENMNRPSNRPAARGGGRDDRRGDPLRNDRVVGNMDAGDSDISDESDLSDLSASGLSGSQVSFGSGSDSAGIDDDNSLSDSGGRSSNLSSHGGGGNDISSGFSEDDDDF